MNLERVTDWIVLSFMVALLFIFLFGFGLFAWWAVTEAVAQ